MTNTKITLKSQVQAFVAENPGLKRKQYIQAFVELGLSDNAASLYHYLYVTKVNKQIKLKAPARCPKTGRYMKRVA